MKHVIFYSWQSDLPNNTNRGFIQAALEEAAKAVATDLNVEPVIERDTKNVPGSPNITDAIFKKITACDIFVADVTLINPGSERRTPNPNVILELGYAMRGLTDERIILVMNAHYGRVEDLPFDLRMRRTIVYNSKPDDEDKATERHKLASILTAAIKDAIQTIPAPTPPTDAIEDAITSIEAVAPNRAVQTRKAMTQVVTDLEALAPPLFRDKATVDDLLKSIDATAPTVARFTRLADMIAGMNDNETAQTLYKNFTAVFEHYNNPRRFSGTWDERDFDYWKFLGHELLTTLIAALLDNEDYEIIENVLDESIRITNPSSGGGAKTVNYEYANEYLLSLRQLQDEKGRISYHADVLRNRHAHAGQYDAKTNGPLSDVMPFETFMAADYFLYLRSELSPDEAPTRYFNWVPWSSLFMTDTPSFIHNAIKTKTAEQLTRSLGIKDIATLKTRLTERLRRLEIAWRHQWETPLQQRDIEQIGTR